MFFGSLIKKKKKITFIDFPGGSMADFVLPMRGAQVQSQVR